MERLGIRINCHKFNATDFVLHHPVQRRSACAANANDFDLGKGLNVWFYFGGLLASGHIM